MKHILRLAFLLLMASTPAIQLIGADISKKNPVITDFENAYARGKLEIVQTMLNKEDIDPLELGRIYSLVRDTTQDQACAKAIAAKNPYAYWDYYTTTHNGGIPRKCFKNARVILKTGSVLPFIDDREYMPCSFAIQTIDTSHVPVLHYFVVMRELDDAKNMKPVDIETVTFLLKNGANTRYKGSSGIADYLIHKSHTHILPAEKRGTEVDAYFFLDYTLPEDTQKLKAAFEKYAQKPDEHSNYNTTDMFYPGTPFYRPVEKDTKKE